MFKQSPNAATDGTIVAFFGHYINAAVTVGGVERRSGSSGSGSTPATVFAKAPSVAFRRGGGGAAIAGLTIDDVISTFTLSFTTVIYYGGRR